MQGLTSKGSVMHFGSLRREQLLLKVYTPVSFIHLAYNCLDMDIMNMHSIVVTPKVSVLLGKTMEASY